MARMFPRAALLIASLFLSWNAAFAVEPVKAPYAPPGMWVWDNWFAHDGQQWHAFYLQLPKAVGPERRYKDNDFYKHVGHAVSKDLLHWQDLGPALGALSGTWNDRHIATGSVIQHEGKWWMLFTGRGTKGDGLGLALSDDLVTWKTEPQPLFPLCGTFDQPTDGPFKSTWQGQPKRWIGISDPYIYPEKIDGWFYLILCGRVLGVPIEKSGCLGLARSRDLRQWEEAGIIAWPGYFERMETPQLWKHDSKWYLSFGGVLNEPWLKQAQPALPPAVQGRRTHQNYHYLLDHFAGPADDSRLFHITAPKSSFIMKVLTAEPGKDVAIFTTSSTISIPYRVEYGADGAVKLPEVPIAR